MRYVAVSERIRAAEGECVGHAWLFSLPSCVYGGKSVRSICLTASAFNDEVSILFDLSRQLLEGLSGGFINGFLV